MASQGEREPGVEMDVELLESMVQDEIPEQEMLVVEEQEQFSPQTDPKPEMGAAAAAAYDTSPPPLRQNPPIRLEQSAVDMILQAINGMKNEMDSMNSKMDANMQAFRNDMRALRGETRQVGQCLQAGIMATPRAGANELRGSATAVRPQWRRVRRK